MPAVGLEFLLPHYVYTEEAYQDNIVATDPPLGSGFQRTTPGETVDIYLSVRAQLDCSATVANRVVRFNILNTVGAIIGTVSAGTVVTASQSAAMRGNINYGSYWEAVDGAVHQINMPLFFFAVFPGQKFEITASSLQAGDKLFNVAFVLQRFWTGPVATPPTPQQLVTSPLSTSTLAIVSTSSSAPTPSEASASPSGSGAPAADTQAAPTAPAPYTGEPPRTTIPLPGGKPVAE